MSPDFAEIHLSAEGAGARRVDVARGEVFDWIEFDDLVGVAIALGIATILVTAIVFGGRR